MCGAATYVPRASWTSSDANPMKDPEFSVERVAAEQQRAVAKDAAMKHLVKASLTRQMEHKESVQKAVQADKAAILHATNKEVDRHRDEQGKLVGMHAQKFVDHNAALDEQTAHLAKRSHENKLREVQEAAELKVRNARQLCHEMVQRDRQKRAMHKQHVEQIEAVEQRNAERRAERQRDNEDFRVGVQEALLQDEYALVATNQRLKAAQAMQDTSCKVWTDTVGKTEEAKRQRFERQLDDDEKMHIHRMDMHYSRREAARERQRQNFVQGLNAQMDSRCTDKDLKKVRQEAEKHALQANIRGALQKELQAHRHHRSQESALQKDLVAQMAEKHEREKREGVARPIALNTMASGSFSKSMPDLSRSLEASKFVAKPLGRAESSPNCGRKDWLAVSPMIKAQNGAPAQVPMHFGPEKWKKGMSTDNTRPALEIDRTAGLGGVMGCLSSIGEAGMALQATGGSNRLLAQSSAIAQQDKILEAAWHRGLSGRDLKAAQKTASAREKAGAIMRDPIVSLTPTHVRRNN